MSTLSKTKTFDTAEGSCEFTVTQLPAMRSGKLLMRLGRTIGPGLAAAVAAFDGKAEALPAAVSAMFEKLDGDELEYVTRELLSSAQVKVKGEIVEVMPHFDLLMQGQIPSWFKLLWFALETNYGNFTGALGGLAKWSPAGTLAQLKKATATPGSFGAPKG